LKKVADDPPSAGPGAALRLPVRGRDRPGRDKAAARSGWSGLPGLRAYQPVFTESARL